MWIMLFLIHCCRLSTRVSERIKSYVTVSPLHLFIRNGDVWHERWGFVNRWTIVLWMNERHIVTGACSFELLHFSLYYVKFMSFLHTWTCSRWKYKCRRAGDAVELRYHNCYFSQCVLVLRMFLLLRILVLLLLFRLTNTEVCQERWKRWQVI